MAISGNPDREYFGLDSKHSERWAAVTNDALESRHRSCRPDTAPKPVLSLLRTCKQIYAEAKHIQYSSNTWAFQDSLTFSFFFSALTEQQRSIVKAFAFDVEWVDDYDWRHRIMDESDEEEEVGEEDSDYADVADEYFRPTIGGWNQIFNPLWMDRFTGLKTLHVHFLEKFTRPLSFNKAMIDGGLAGEGVLHFSRLPLETATVIVTCAKADVDPEIDEELEDPEAIPLRGRQHHARLIKDILLRDAENMDRVERLLQILADDDPGFDPAAWKDSRRLVHQRVLDQWEAEMDTEDD